MGVGVLHIDFETQSEVDLKKTGAYVYADHPSTHVLCAGVKIDDDPIIVLGGDDPRLRHLISDADKIVAHNALFEMAIIHYTLNLEIPPHRFDCTMARALRVSMPASLDVLAKALRLETGKHAEGRRAMMWFSRKLKETGKIPDPEDYPEKLQQVMDYCKIDVELEVQADKLLPQMTDKEREIQLLDWEINLRGVAVDVDACRNAVRMADKAKDKANQKMSDLTGGVVTSVSQTKVLTEWITERGFDGENTRAQVLRNWLLEGKASPEVRKAIQIKLGSQKTSVAKYDAILKSHLGGRVQGLFQYHGANTGRWAGRRVQLQNLTRPASVIEDPAWQDYLLTKLSKGGDILDDLELCSSTPLDALASLVRGVLWAPEGKLLVGADLSNIEGRIVAWLAGDTKKLRRFSDYDEGKGPDIYLATAADMYNVTVEEARPYRMIGKIAELALGYQGSTGAFLSMANAYGTEFADEDAKGIVDKWRLANARIKSLWYATQDAAIMAVVNPGAMFTAGRVRYVVHGAHLKAILPSGRGLTYPYVRLEDGKYGKKIVFEGHPQAKHGRNKTQWGTVDTYGGKLVENNTQALARDVLAENMIKIDKRWPIVLHVHDEVVSEVYEDKVDLKAFEDTLASVPDWAEGLPLSSEGFIGKRYRK